MFKRFKSVIDMAFFEFSIYVANVTKVLKGEYMHDHDAILQKVKNDLPTDELICDLADLFKIFGDTTRAKILFALFESEMCVCAIAELLGMTQPAISHQLKILKDAKLVGNRRDGKTIYYFLLDDHVKTIIGQGFDHLIEERNELNNAVSNETTDTKGE